MTNKRNRKKTEAESIHEYLLSIGAHEVTEEEKNEEWYKIGRASISCETESEEEFWSKVHLSYPDEQKRIGEQSRAVLSSIKNSLSDDIIKNRDDRM